MWKKQKTHLGGRTRRGCRYVFLAPVLLVVFAFVMEVWTARLAVADGLEGIRTDYSGGVHRLDVAAADGRAGTSTDSAGGVHRPDVATEDGRTGSLTLVYEDLDGEPVAGADFSLRKVAERTWDGGFQSLVGVEVDAETEPEAVRGLVASLPAKSLLTGADGAGRIENLSEGLYLVEEVSPAEGHYPSVPFFAAIPTMQGGEWVWEVLAEPKPLATGSLRLSKTVEGSTGEREREFRFRVRLGAEGEFPVRYSFDAEEDGFGGQGETDQRTYSSGAAGGLPVTHSTGAEGSVRDGGVLFLRHGQSATVSMLPAGTSYDIEELDAGMEGYEIASVGETGNIPLKDVAQVSFINRRGDAPTPTPTKPFGPPPQTGDESGAGTYLLLALVSLSCILFFFVGRRRFGINGLGNSR